MTRPTGTNEARARVGDRAACRQRGNALAEFVLVLPILLFVMVTTFVIGRGLARKQRTIAASRYATHATLLGVGDTVENPQDGQQYPDPHPWRGLLHPYAFHDRYFSYLPLDWSGLERRFGGDGSDALRGRVNELDVDDEILATEVISSFWETHGPGLDILYRERGDGFNGHWGPHGMRVWVKYEPRGLEETLGGPFADRFLQDDGSGRTVRRWDARWERFGFPRVAAQTWEWRHPDVWRQLFWTPTLQFDKLKDDLIEFDRIVHRFTYDPYDPASFERWFYYSWPRRQP